MHITEAEAPDHFAKLSYSPMEAMDEEAIDEVNPSWPLISRLNHLELMMQILMERRCLSRELPSLVASELEPRDQHKTISAAFEEVREKGSMADRLAMLEKRLFQLSLELEERRSTSCVALANEDRENGTYASRKTWRLQREERPVESRREETRKGRARKRNDKSSSKKRWLICS